MTTNHRPMPSTTATTMGMTMPSMTTDTTTDMTTTTTISVRSNSSLKIICELENNDATVVCRSFDKLQVCKIYTLLRLLNLIA
jgi:hypothetical protein